MELRLREDAAKGVPHGAITEMATQPIEIKGKNQPALQDKIWLTLVKIKHRKIESGGIGHEDYGLLSD